MVRVGLWLGLGASLLLIAAAGHFFNVSRHLLWLWLWLWLPVHDPRGSGSGYRFTMNDLIRT